MCKINYQNTIDTFIFMGVYIHERQLEHALNRILKLPSVLPEGNSNTKRLTTPILGGNSSTSTKPNFLGMIKG